MVAFPLLVPPLPDPEFDAAEEADGAGLVVSDGGVVSVELCGDGLDGGGATGEEDAVVGGGTGDFGRGKAPGA